MKNRAVVQLIKTQYNVKSDDVKVEFTHSIGNEYFYNVGVKNGNLLINLEVSIKSNNVGTTIYD